MRSGDAFRSVHALVAFAVPRKARTMQVRLHPRRTYKPQTYGEPEEKSTEPHTGLIIDHVFSTKLNKNLPGSLLDTQGNSAYTVMKKLKSFTQRLETLPWSAMILRTISQSPSIETSALQSLSLPHWQRPPKSAHSVCSNPVIRAVVEQ